MSVVFTAEASDKLIDKVVVDVISTMDVLNASRKFEMAGCVLRRPNNDGLFSNLKVLLPPGDVMRSS